MESIMTALAPLESRHPRLGQSLWWLWVMRPRCLHAHAAPAGVLVCVCVGGRRGGGGGAFESGAAAASALEAPSHGGSCLRASFLVRITPRTPAPAPFWR